MPIAKTSKPKAVKPAAPAPATLETSETAAATETSTPSPVTAEVTPAVTPAPTAASPVPSSAEPVAVNDLNQPGFPLHPERVWPD